MSWQHNEGLPFNNKILEERPRKRIKGDKSPNKGAERSRTTEKINIDPSKIDTKPAFNPNWKQTGREFNEKVLE